jgi:hypothetical protein
MPRNGPVLLTNICPGISSKRICTRKPNSRKSWENEGGEGEEEHEEKSDEKYYLSNAQLRLVFSEIYQKHLIASYMLFLAGMIMPRVLRKPLAPSYR